MTTVGARFERLVIASGCELISERLILIRRSKQVECHSPAMCERRVIVDEMDFVDDESQINALVG